MPCRDTQSPPNFIVIYADDLGFGDVGCYGADGIPTPHLDAMAGEGVRFANFYATAATCTPSRYSLLTGSYPWRNPRARILDGDAPIIIGPEELTLPAALRRAGYATSVVGKWHLGLGNGSIDWNGEIRPSPVDVGFDESFIMAATNDRVPTVYVKNRQVHNLDPNETGFTSHPIRARPSSATRMWNQATHPNPSSTTSPPISRQIPLPHLPWSPSISP